MKYLVTILIFGSMVGFSYGQPTYTAAQFVQAFSLGGLNGGDNYTSTATTGFDGLAAISGPNQIWDFQPFSFTKDAPQTDEFKQVTGFEPLATSFPTATYVDITTTDNITTYDYIMLNDTGMFNLGSVDDTLGGGKGVTVVYSPPFQVLKFPLTYQTTWQTSQTIAGVTVQINSTVDGWGTFSLPEHTGLTCLRLKMESTVSGFPINTYRWFAPDGTSATVAINPFAQSASYRIPPGANSVFNNDNTSDIHINTNPVNRTTIVSLSLPIAGETTLRMLDIAGNNCLILFNTVAAAGTMTLPLDATNLANGTYFLRVESPGLTAMRKIIVAH